VCFILLNSYFLSYINLIYLKELILKSIFFDECELNIVCFELLVFNSRILVNKTESVAYMHFTICKVSLYTETKSLTCV